MADLKVQEQKRIDAECWRLVISVLEQIVPQVVEKFDGKVLNARFQHALTDKAREVFGVSENGNTKYSFWWKSSSDYDFNRYDAEDGTKYQANEIHMYAHELHRKYGYQHVCSEVSFNVFTYKDEKGNQRLSKEVSMLDMGRGWNCPTLTDKIRLIKAEIAKLENCTADKVDLCKEKLLKISEFIRQELDGMEKDGSSLPSHDFMNIVGMKEAVKEITKDNVWYSEKELRALYNFHWMVDSWRR